ncbi:hypothetical protein NM688_g4754 [Phlebia brevispora]|uniref:Uncharacterized protein n=1 Tax=Phlebia brevispora TaxID=194682 RepID=A0ACC1T229_9APHY|nr:hypothetical protein NM688_g4754 [Phlebia brevispora]
MSAKIIDRHVTCISLVDHPYDRSWLFMRQGYSYPMTKGLRLKFECTICHDRFPTSFSRSSHLAKSHLDTLCRQCNRYYLSQTSLQQHYRTDPSHPSCPRCDEGFPNNSSLSAHLSAAHPPELCEPCGIVFKDEKLLEMHYKDSGAHPKCVVCDVGLLDSLCFDQHVQKLHPELYCDICAIGFQTDDRLRLHYKQSEWKQHPTCVICNEGFKDHAHGVSSSSDAYERIPYDLYVIKCNTTYETAGDLEEHYRRSPMHPTCTQCGTGLFDDLAFFQHKIIVHKHSHIDASHTEKHGLPQDSRSPGGVFALDEDLLSPGAGPQGSFLAGEGQTRRCTENAPPYKLYSMPHAQRSSQPSPVASSYLVTSLYLEEEEENNQPLEDFEVLDGHDARAASTPRLPILAQSLSYRSASWTPTSRLSSFSDSSSSTRESGAEGGAGTGYVTPYLVRSDRGSVRSWGSARERFSPPIATADAASSGLRPSRPPSLLSRVSGSQAKPSADLEACGAKHSNSGAEPCRAVESGSNSRRDIEGDYGLSLDGDDTHLHVEGKIERVHPTRGAFSPLSSSTPEQGTAAGAKQNSPWVCRVCLKEPTEPTATVCGHLFCNRCIISHLSKNFQCPVCRRSLLISLFLSPS